jgi:hypothetical protein
VGPHARSEGIHSSARGTLLAAACFSATNPDHIPVNASSTLLSHRLLSHDSEQLASGVDQRVAMNQG